MEYSKCCRDCVLNHDCSYQKNNDVESCGDYEFNETKISFESIKKKNKPKINNK